jgi:hypothetical protein
MEMVRKEFLLNVASNLEDVAARLKDWIAQANDVDPENRTEE